MAGLNQCTFIGHLGGNPERRNKDNEKSPATFRVACTERWKDNNGMKREHTEWVNVVAFGNLADIAINHLSTGRQVCVIGRLRTKSWEKKDGSKGYWTEVIADKILFLGGVPEPIDADEKPKTESTEDDLPF